MTTDPLAEALAELRRVAKQPITGVAIASGTIGLFKHEEVATILNAALSGELMRKSEHLAAMAAANEAAAGARGLWLQFNSEGEPSGGYCTVELHDPGDMVFYVNRDAIRTLTTVDQQAALDRMIQAAIANELKRIEFAWRETPAFDAARRAMRQRIAALADGVPT